MRRAGGVSFFFYSTGSVSSRTRIAWSCLSISITLLFRNSTSAADLPTPGSERGETLEEEEEERRTTEGDGEELVERDLGEERKREGGREGGRVGTD